MYPERQEFCGRGLAEDLAWCLVWLMRLEIGIGLPLSVHAR
jgi:hypothetical protein